jgi:hypothetical protein
MLVQDKIALDFAEFTLVKDNIVIIDYLGEETMNVERGIKVVETVHKLSNNEPCAVIHNVGNKYIFSTDALRFMGSQLDSQHKYLARTIVTTNAAARLASNNFIKLYKPLVPTKIFTEVGPALAWLEGVLSSEK